MSYFEKTKLTDSLGDLINPAEEESLTLLRRIFQLLKPLGTIQGLGSNRLSVSIGEAASATLGAVATVTTVASVTAVQNQANMGGITAYDLIKAMSRTAYNGGVRSKIV